jgi:hypothetical protein
MLPVHMSMSYHFYPKQIAWQILLTRHVVQVLHEAPLRPCKTYEDLWTRAVVRIQGMHFAAHV